MNAASASARHVFRQDLRAEAVAALACVDYVAVGKSNHPSEAIQLVRPDVFVPADADADEEDDSTESPGATTEDAILRALGVRVVQIKNSGLKSAAWKHQYSPAFPAESSGFLGPSLLAVLGRGRVRAVAAGPFAAGAVSGRGDHRRVPVLRDDGQVGQGAGAGGPISFHGEVRRRYHGHGEPGRPPFPTT